MGSEREKVCIKEAEVRSDSSKTLIQNKIKLDEIDKPTIEKLENLRLNIAY